MKNVATVHRIRGGLAQNDSYRTNQPLVFWHNLNILKGFKSKPLWTSLPSI